MEPGKSSGGYQAPCSCHSQSENFLLQKRQYIMDLLTLTRHRQDLLKAWLSSVLVCSKGVSSGPQRKIIIWYCLVAVDESLLKITMSTTTTTKVSTSFVCKVSPSPNLPVCVFVKSDQISSSSDGQCRPTLWSATPHPRRPENSKATRSALTARLHGQLPPDALPRHKDGA